MSVRALPLTRWVRVEDVIGRLSTFVDALAAARRVQAKADKIEAERALGTLPGMETTR